MRRLLMGVASASIVGRGVCRSSRFMFTNEASSSLSFSGDFICYDFKICQCFSISKKKWTIARKECTDITAVTGVTKRRSGACDKPPPEHLPGVTNIDARHANRTAKIHMHQGIAAYTVLIFYSNVIFYCFEKLKRVLYSVVLPQHIKREKRLGFLRPAVGSKGSRIFSLLSAISSNFSERARLGNPAS